MNQSKVKEKIKKLDEKIKNLREVRYKYVIQLKNIDTQNKKILANNILEEVSNMHGVGEEEILGRDRHQEVSNARKDFCRILRKNGYTLERIGDILGRNHGTIVYLLR